MASFTLGSDPRFHVGDTIYCYAAGGGLIPANPTPVTSSTVASDSTTTFTGLSDDARYLAGKVVTGPFITFQTVPASSETGGTAGLGTFTKGVVIDIDGFGGIERPDTDSVEWIQPEAPVIGDGATEARDGDTWIPSVVEE